MVNTIQLILDELKKELHLEQKPLKPEPEDYFELKPPLEEPEDFAELEIPLEQLYEIPEGLVDNVIKGKIKNKEEFYKMLENVEGIEDLEDFIDFCVKKYSTKELTQLYQQLFKIGVIGDYIDIVGEDGLLELGSKINPSTFLLSLNSTWVLENVDVDFILKNIPDGWFISAFKNYSRKNSRNKIGEIINDFWDSILKLSENKRIGILYEMIEGIKWGTKLSYEEIAEIIGEKNLDKLRYNDAESIFGDVERLEYIMSADWLARNRKFVELAKKKMLKQKKE